MLSSRTQYRKVSYREKRKDRRILFPPLAIVVAGTAFETANWSFGGFLIDGCDLEVGFGDQIAGTLGWEELRFAFAGRVSRFGGEARELAVGFTEISDDALMFLDRRLSDYLATQKRK